MDPLKVRTDAENLITHANSKHTAPVALIEFLLNVKSDADCTFIPMWGIGVGCLLESCGILCNEENIRKLSSSLENAEKWIACWNEYKEDKEGTRLQTQCKPNIERNHSEIFKSFMKKKIDVLTQLNAAAVNTIQQMTPAMTS